jgi:hypothetical protein
MHFAFQTGDAFASSSKTFYRNPSDLHEPEQPQLSFVATAALSLGHRQGNSQQVEPSSPAPGSAVSGKTYSAASKAQ